MPCEQLLLTTFDHLLGPSQCKPQKNIQPFLHIDHILSLFSSSDDHTADEDEEANVSDEIEFETVLPFRDSDSEPELEQLRSVSDFDLFSSSDEEESTSLAAFAFAHMRGRGAVVGTLWSMMVISTFTLCPIIGQAGRGGVADEQRHKSPGLLICQAGLEAAVEEPEPLGHPSLVSDPPRKVSKSQKILLKHFITSLLEN